MAKKNIVHLADSVKIQKALSEVRAF